MTAASPAHSDERRRLRDKLKAALLTPIRAMRLRYLPLLMIYYAYGALGSGRHCRSLLDQAGL
jgi:hypothetical protein